MRLSCCGQVLVWDEGMSLEAWVNNIDDWSVSEAEQEQEQREQEE